MSERRRPGPLRTPATSSADLEAAHRTIELANRHGLWPQLFTMTEDGRPSWPDVLACLQAKTDG